MIDKTDWQAVYRKLMEEEILQKDAPPPYHKTKIQGIFRTKKWLVIGKFCSNACARHLRTETAGARAGLEP